MNQTANMDENMIRRQIYDVFGRYGLDVNTIDRKPFDKGIDKYIVSCLHIAPIYFIVHVNSDTESYQVHIIDNKVGMDNRSSSFFRSLEGALKDAAFWYTEDMKPHATLYNILNKNS